MVPPEETKGDQDEEPWDEGAGGGAPAGGGRVPEVRGAEAAPAAKVPTVTIGASSPAWTTAGWKPGANVRGADVVLDAPDGVPDDKFNEVRASLRAAGAVSVAEAVMCNHCRETMTTLDPACPACGAGYDDDGKLLSRPCLAQVGSTPPTTQPCGGQVSLEGDGPRWICAKCGTLHEGTDGASWRACPKEAPPAPAADPPRRGRGRAEPAATAPAPEPPPGDERKRGVPFDQPGAGKPAARSARR
jgi:ribosomal protein S27AE